jgi:hypothetical protein
MVGRTLFFCFAPADLPFAAALRDALQKFRVQAVLGRVDLPAGVPLWGGVRSRLERSDGVVLLVSRDCLDCTNVPYEIGIAQMSEKPLLAVALPDALTDSRNRDLLRDVVLDDSQLVLEDGPDPADVATWVCSRLHSSIPRPWWRRWF